MTTSSQADSSGKPGEASGLRVVAWFGDQPGRNQGVILDRVLRTHIEEPLWVTFYTQPLVRKAEADAAMTELREERAMWHEIADQRSVALIEASSDRDHWRTRAEQAEAKVAVLGADALDAARYRFWRSACDGRPDQTVMEWFTPAIHPLNARTLDAAIDAAMKEGNAHD